MPELPEVETIVQELLKAKPKILGSKILDFWTDWKKMIKKPKSLEEFRKELIGRQILDIKRRAKNILFFLDKEKVLLVHQKLTGHLLYGKWKKKNKEWEAEIEGPLKSDPQNRFIHFILFLSNGWQIALSDVRKFAKIELLDKEELEKELAQLGPEPLDDSFTFEKFKEAILKKKKGKIKQVLMDQRVIAGIGNIYSDEALWIAKISPFRKVSDIKEEELKELYLAIKKVLKIGVQLHGESISDFRRIDGSRGEFDEWRKVYRKEGEKCERCEGKIVAKKIGQRTAHFCPICQK
jgi:formamidopyrimidine-DNA glycosylase